MRISQYYPFFACMQQVVLSYITNALKNGTANLTLEEFQSIPTLSLLIIHGLGFFTNKLCCLSTSTLIVQVCYLLSQYHSLINNGVVRVAAYFFKFQCSVPLLLLLANIAQELLFLYASSKTNSRIYLFVMNFVISLTLLSYLDFNAETILVFSLFKLLLGPFHFCKCKLKGYMIISILIILTYLTFYASHNLLYMSRTNLSVLSDIGYKLSNFVKKIRSK